MNAAATLDKPSDTWTVTNKAGIELARVDGVLYTQARNTAAQLDRVRASAAIEGGYGMRRLMGSEL